MSAAAACYRLPPVPYVRLAFSLRALAPAALPEYKGSMLRGAFGQALRRMVCIMGKEQACGNCRLRRECTYTRLFETFIEGEAPPLLRGLPTSPRPFVFEPHGDARQFGAGETLAFDLLLIGRAADLQAFAILAVERMAEAGLGSGRHRFVLERVACREPSGGWREALVGTGLVPGVPTVPICELPDTSRTLLRFLTPTRLKIRDHLVATIDFRGLTFAMLRRTLELAHFHVAGADVDWTFRPLLEHATAVKIRASRLHWRDWQRYSNRQRSTMSLGGFVGELEVEGDLVPFAPLLRAAEILHVGKGATFGLGKMEIV